MSIKEEVLKELTKGFSEDLDWGNIDSEPAVNRAIDLTQQKMIEEFKEIIDKVPELKYEDEDSFKHKYLRISREELKSQVEKT